LTEIPVCAAYERNGKRMDTLDFSGDARLLAGCRPILETLPGWQEDLHSCREWQDLPKEARSYVEFIESKIGVPVRTLSVGPERSAIVRHDQP